MKVINYYDVTLQEITDCVFEEIVVSEGTRFGKYLFFVFKTYPDISKRYPPGVLGFTLNKMKPTELDLLRDGDEIHFEVVFTKNSFRVYN